MTQKTITCKYLRGVVLICTLKQLQIYDSFREAFKDLARHYDSSENSTIICRISNINYYEYLLPLQ